MKANPDTRHIHAAELLQAKDLMPNYYDKSWGLVIGINEYGGRHPTLANARNDATAFAELLRRDYQFDHVFDLYDEEATGDTITEWLRDKLPAQVGSNDRVIIFFAGHGTTRQSGRGEKRGYLIPHDAKPGQYANYIDMIELRDACGWIPAKHVFLILDCCFSGIAAITARSSPALQPKTMNDAYLREITKRSAWQVLTAGASDELAADSGSRPGHSAFTSALLAGLEGQADHDEDGIITASELAGFVKPEVSRHSMDHHARGQTPFFNYLSGSDQGDFVFLRPTGINLRPATAIDQLPWPKNSTFPLWGIGLLGLLAIVILFLYTQLPDTGEKALAEFKATMTVVSQETATAAAATLAAAPTTLWTQLVAQQTQDAQALADQSAGTLAGTPTPSSRATARPLATNTGSQVAAVPPANQQTMATVTPTPISQIQASSSFTQDVSQASQDVIPSQAISSTEGANFSGDWETNFAALTIRQTGNAVQGSYYWYGDQTEKTFTGTVVDSTLTAQTSGGSEVSLVLVDENSFAGEWVSPTERGDWCGVRPGRPLPAGCGFSGIWQTRYLVNGEEQVVDAMLEQEGAQVIGHYKGDFALGSLMGNLGIAGNDRHYKLIGEYAEDDEQDQGRFRFDLLDYGSDQFQGCWESTTTDDTGAWCGWRPGLEAPTSCTPTVACP